MTIEAVLTDHQIMATLVRLYEKHKSDEMGELRVRSDLVPIGRAIEQDVLQSPEIQRLREERDAYFFALQEITHPEGARGDATAIARAAINAAMKEQL